MNISVSQIVQPLATAVSAARLAWPTATARTPSRDPGPPWPRRDRGPLARGADLRPSAAVL